MNKTYIVDLSKEERAQVLELVRRGKARARKLRRAHIVEAGLERALVSRHLSRPERCDGGNRRTAVKETS